jgi:hypothetical protein
MERPKFGPTNREVAVIGQGTWYIDIADRASAIVALQRGLDKSLECRLQPGIGFSREAMPD